MVLLAGALVCVGLVGCGITADGPSEVAIEVAATPEARLDEAWPIVFATEDSVADYGGKQGWVSLVMMRDTKKAVEQLGPAGGTAAARAHNEAAYMYRQAALLQANSLVQTYAAAPRGTPQPTDPLGTAHLLTVSFAVLGEIDEARAASAKLDGVDDPTRAWHAPWEAWLEGEAVWPPDLSDLPVELPEPAPGAWPELADHPHYELPEQGSDSVRPMADPSALLALAFWHDAAARKAAPDASAMLSTARAGYGLPVEPAPAAAGALPMDLLFGSDLLVPADADFLAAVHGEAGAAAVDQFAGKSLLAWLAQQSRSGDKIDAEKAVDVLAGFRADLLERAKSKTGGEAKAHQRQFVDIAYVGAFRSLALVAEVEGDREVSGRLRINALDRSQKATACPVGLIALGAWDASNRYPTRAQEILHAQARRFPSLETARYGLDVMALRVSRERPGETPGM